MHRRPGHRASRSARATLSTLSAKSDARGWQYEKRLGTKRKLRPSLGRRVEALLAQAGLGARGAIQRRGKPVRLRIVRVRAHKNIRRLDVAAVIGPVPVVGDVDDGAVEIQAAVDAFRAAERDEVRADVD